MNIAETKGLTSDFVASAQKLTEEFANSKDLPIPLDRYLKTTSPSADGAMK